MQLIRVGFLLVSGFAGYAIFVQNPDLITPAFLGVLPGLAVGGLAVALEVLCFRSALHKVFWGLTGLLIGATAAGILNLVLGGIFPNQPGSLFAGRLTLLLLLSYLGLSLGLKSNGDVFSLVVGRRQESPQGTNNKILDTSVIIDGRIADLCETGFMEGTFIAPHFILQELQHIADSSDALKRARGRRGLDILHRIQKMAEIDVQIVEDDFPQIKDVDSKVVALAKKIDAKIVTNDLNLNKVAGLQGVQVLNINELCNALKPVVLPGETMRVFILKEGKESGQGIAYLDDGTMIVVDEAKRWIGKNVDVAVTSVLQTTAGRMIFTRMREDPDREDLPTAKSAS